MRHTLTVLLDEGLERRVRHTEEVQHTTLCNGMGTSHVVLEQGSIRQRPLPFEAVREVRLRLRPEQLAALQVQRRRRLLRQGESELLRRVDQVTVQGMIRVEAGARGDVVLVDLMLLLLLVGLQLPERLLRVLRGGRRLRLFGVGATASGIDSTGTSGKSTGPWV